MIIDHVGIAVRSLKTAIPQWEVLFGYRQDSEVITNTRQKVRVVFLCRPGSLSIKLIEPSEPSSPLVDFVKRGGGLHHLCFRGESVDADVARMAAAGARVLAQPEPGEAFENERIAFVYAAGLNIEIIDTEKRARRLNR